MKDKNILRFTWKSGEINTNQCQERKCKHYLGNDKCLAFPEGIPDEIAYGDNPHTAPYPGDHGIRYEKK